MLPTFGIAAVHPDVKTPHLQLPSSRHQGSVPPALPVFGKSFLWPRRYTSLHTLRPLHHLQGLYQRDAKRSTSERIRIAPKCSKRVLVTVLLPDADTPRVMMSCGRSGWSIAKCQLQIVKEIFFSFYLLRMLNSSLMGTYCINLGANQCTVDLIKTQHADPCIVAGMFQVVSEKTLAPIPVAFYPADPSTGMTTSLITSIQRRAGLNSIQSKTIGASSCQAIFCRCISP